MNYKFFQNKDCEYFPCHKIKNEEEFNCLFCFCPLYGLKEHCGGNPQYIEGNIKDCSQCISPHLGEKGHDFIMSKIDKIIELGKKVD